MNQRPDIKYEALSYTWGNKKHTRQVYLAEEGSNNPQWRPYPLHENLWRFLRHARQEKMFRRLFWTDHLCLGSSPRARRRQGAYAGVQDAASAAPLICAGYWRRVWVVQEIAMAKRVWVIYGDVRIDLDELLSRMETYRPAGYRSGNLNHADGFHGGFAHVDSSDGSDILFERHGPVLVSPMWELCDLHKAGGKIPLWKLLYNFKGYQSSRPADKVYGLLGLIAHNEDGTSPIENMQVDYEKPLVNVWLDVLFESSPPWEPLKEMILGTLIDTEWYPSHGSLVAYLDSSQTSERHKELAYLTLRVNHALYVAMEELISPIFADYNLPSIYRLVISGMEMDFKPTIQQAAAILGFSLSMSRQTPRPEMSSGWQCAAHHRLADEKSRWVVADNSKRVAESVYALPRGYLHRILRACEEHPESCDGSVIVFEMPHVGFYMSVETFDGHSRGTFRVEIEDRRSMAEGEEIGPGK
ncbi:hypothetical protein VMCG_08815 [Cytospora schulzeri]|uniref:Heterokaryon incompatibility domain-containing protein n=1 Tax=Cytospora schulzeri TaxID=448051 RepID=A0A423VS24_9PEZI|nr:hypothetical protein VMCG_08815 [Valsa malicola]